MQGVAAQLIQAAAEDAAQQGKANDFLLCSWGGDQGDQGGAFKPFVQDT